MKIKSIFVANIGEAAKPLMKLMGRAQWKEEIFEDQALSDRFLLSCEDNWVLLTAFPLDKEFFEDIKKILGLKNVLNLWPKKPRDSTCLDILEDKNLLKKIVEIMEQNAGIKMRSYAGTREFRTLISYLQKKGLVFEAPEMTAEENLWTSSFFDSKAGFRQAMNYLGIRMPEGVICSGKEEIIGWADYFLKKAGGVVLKTNRGLSGAGLKIIQKKDLAGKNPAGAIELILQSEIFWKKELTVAEEFIEPDLEIGAGAASVEMQVDERGAHYLYSCGMRITKEGNFLGVEIGKESMPVWSEENLFRSGKKFGSFLYKMGYRGFFDMDFVLSKKKKLFALEANLRRTGGTHAFQLAKKLMKGKFYLVSVDKADVKRLKNKSYSWVKKRLNSLLYPIAGKKEGVILTIINYLPKGKLGYIVVGKNKERVLEIEAEMKEKIN